MEMRQLRLGQRGDRIERFPDGTVILSSPEPLATYARSYTQRLVHWAREAGDRIFLAQREGQGESWRTLTYADALEKVKRIAQALLNRGLSQERTLMILSGNEIEHALLALAAMHVGIAYSPISVNYSLLGTDFAKLRHCFDLLTPSLVYVSDAQQYQKALDEVVPADVEVVCRANPIPGRKITLFDEFLEITPTSMVSAAADAVRPEMAARILFTSGSSAMPKGAINTHQVLCANQTMTAQTIPFILDDPPVICDWLPWNHTFGGGQWIGVILFSGGTLYIDDGRPLPGQIERTIENLQDVRPTIFIGVPSYFEAILPFLQSDAGFRKAFFSRMTMLFYSTASLPDPVSDAYQQLAFETKGQRIFTISAYGATETGPLATICNWVTQRKGVVGLPIPGLQLKLIPNNGKLEARVKGPSVVPGYFRQPALTAKAFDADGWYCMGDALRFADPNDLSEGLIFDGRIAEDFKLNTGTWVNVGPLTILATNELSPLAMNVLVCGINRHEIGLLVFPDLEACRRMARMPKGAILADILQSEILLIDFQKRLNAMARLGTGLSNRIARMRISDVPLTNVEVTDKKGLSTNVVLDRRRDEVEDLFSLQPSRLVMTVDHGQNARA